MSNTANFCINLFLQCFTILKEKKVSFMNNLSQMLHKAIPSLPMDPKF